MGPHGLADRGAHVFVQGLADGARLLGAVQDGDGLDGRGDGLDEVLDREGAEEPDLEDSDFFAFLDG